MRFRRLGRTGYEVSEIGFGAWGLGGTMWRGVSDALGKRTVDEALDLGNFLDTALAYGDGHSERVLAEVLAERGGRDQVVIATKIPPMDYEWPAKASTPLKDVFPADWVIRSVEDSLRNLDIEALQVEQLHVWHDAWLDAPEWGPTREAMERLKEQGKVLHWGVSINDHAPETALRVLEDPLIETAQVIYNIFDRSPERALFDLAKRRDLGVIVRVPLDEGALTGAIGPDTTFPAGDWRHEYFKEQRKEELVRRVEALQALLDGQARTLPELALRFCLSRIEVSTVIPGMRHPEHARANAAVSDGNPLSADLLEKLWTHSWKKNWYRG